MKKFTIQDRIILDDALENFRNSMNDLHNKHENSSTGEQPIITREYWEHMLKELQLKIDAFSTAKALSQSNRWKDKNIL